MRDEPLTLPGHEPAAARRPRLLLWTDVGALGGIAEFNHAIAHGMQDRGYAVTLVAPEFNETYRAAEHAAGIEHVEAQLPERQIRGRPALNLATTRSLVAELAPDVVLFADGCEFSNLLAKKAAAELGLPMVFSFGLVLSTAPREVRPLFEEALARAFAVVGVSRQNIQLFNQSYPQIGPPLTIIPYGRPEAFFAPTNRERRAARRKELGAGADDVLFFTAARYESIKGYDLYLAAIERLSREPVWQRMRLAWAGGGPMEGELRAALTRLGLADRVHLLGARHDIDQWLEAADAFVLPSYTEGMPLAIMEAMAKGLPVIATAVGGVPEQLGDAGILLHDPKQVPRTTMRDLARAMAMLAQSQAERDRLGARARQSAAARFREDRMITDYFRLMASATAQAATIAAAPHDYVAPGLSTVRPDAAFPQMILGNSGECDWPYLRRDIMHRWYVDRRFPAVGFLSRDEAHVLYNAALGTAGKPALEIGCFMGWSTCHLALSGVALDVVDPLLANPIFRQSVEASLAAAGCRDRVNLVAGRSPDAIHALARDGRRWGLIFIDGDHEGTAPRLDAAAVEPYAAEDCVVLFHDLAAPAVADGLRHFRERGWNIRVYHTMQIMAAAWRGKVAPPAHVPDPAIAWSLPLHLADFAPDGAFARIHDRCKPFTMTSLPRQFALYQSTRYVVENAIAGDVVECGVWRGGSMMIAALALKELGATDRHLALYDTFAGMTQPTAADREVASGHEARALLAATPRDADNYYWAIAPLDAVKRNLASTGYPADRIAYVVGDVGETLKSGYPRSIALLRLDTDWYESTRCELEQLYERLAPGGVLVVDDYGFWAGAQKACDEFFAARPEKLHPIPDDPVGRILVKGAVELPPDLSRRLRVT